MYNEGYDNGFSPCPSHPCPPKKEKSCGCECVEDPTTRDYRKQLCRLQGRTVVLISNNFFTITEGTVDEVNCGSVELINAEIFGVDAGRVIVGFNTLNLIVPVTNGNGVSVAAALRTNAPTRV